jgi:hypothetical protein
METKSMEKKINRRKWFEEKVSRIRVTAGQGAGSPMEPYTKAKAWLMTCCFLPAFLICECCKGS